MTQILQKRNSLHIQLAEQRKLNKLLKEQNAHMQSLAHIGMVSAMAAHEMNNILTPLQNYAQLAATNPKDKKLTEKAIKKTAANAHKATLILENMLAMANGKRQPRGRHHLKDLIEQVFVCIARDFSKDNINVNLDIPEGFSVFVEPVCMQQVFMNLILNAREAMLESGGDLTIHAESQPDTVTIKITDTGCGIHTKNLENIFKPFYTTKNEKSFSRRKGAGLGLAFCKTIIDDHAGRISVESKFGVGTAFKIVLPNHS